VEHPSLDTSSLLAINIRPHNQLMANDSHLYPINYGILISGIVNLTLAFNVGNVVLVAM
jgi:hypothetical protein